MNLASRAYASALVLTVVGRLDHDSSEAFRAALQPHLEGALSAGQGVVLDLSGLEYVSSAGLRCLMLAAKQVDARGGKFVLAAPCSVVAEILDISRLKLVLRILPSVREALAHISSEAAAAFNKG
jgi:anti-anti-sigma factor